MKSRSVVGALGIAPMLEGAAGAALAADIDDLQSCDLYLAGPPGLIDNAMRELVATGRAAADRVFYDRFC